MAKEENLQIQKSCILLNNGEVTAREWRSYIAKNWKELTRDLSDCYIVILAGRHGNEDGKIGAQDNAIKRHHKEQIQLLKNNNPEVQNDMEEKNIKIEMLDVCNYFDKDDKSNFEDLSLKLIEIGPSILVISICHSVNLDLRFALEVEGIFAHIRLKRDLSLTTKGKQINLDPTQRELLMQLAKDENDQKTVVISGPEGSGKSLLAIEATKMKICSILKQFSGKDRVKIRVVLCAAYQGDNRVPVLFKFLKEELKAFKRYCLIETKPLADLSVNDVKDLQSKIQKELSIDPPVYSRKDDILFTQLLPSMASKKSVDSDPNVSNQQVNKSASKSQQKVTEGKSNDFKATKVHQESETEEERDKMITIVLLDEVIPDFELCQWNNFQSDSNVQYVVAIRHTFSQSSFPTSLKLENVSTLDNTVICVLDKRL